MPRLLLLCVLIATPALARPRHFPGVTADEIRRPTEIEPSVAAGIGLPWTIGARHERRGVLVFALGGYDRAKRDPVMSASLEATLVERITLRATATNNGMLDQVRPGVGLLLDVTRARTRGIDLAIGGEYDMRGWNQIPAVIAQTAVGANIGLIRLQGNAGFGFGLENSERYGDLRLSGLRPVGGRIYVGIDSRARIDLERNADEPSGELDWDLQAGPVATLAFGRVALSATGGLSAWKMRSGGTTKRGPIGALGIGTAF